MGTQQSRSGHGRQGSHQPSQQSDRRPEQDRDLQRVKQGDRGQQHQSGGAKRQPSQGGSTNRQQSQSGTSNRQPSQGAPSDRQPSQGGAASQQSQGGAASEQQPETQQSQLGGYRDYEHRVENEGREQNRMQQSDRRQMSQQDERASGSMDALRGGGEYGEGNYAGTRQYDEAVKDFAESGRVDEAARAAAPRSDAEAREMDAAEAEGKRRAKGEDPALTKGSAAPRPGHEEA